MEEYRGNANPTRFSITLPEAVGTAKPPVKPPKPPWQRFMDLNWKMGKPILKEGAREALVEFIKWFVSGRKRVPAIAQQLAAQTVRREEFEETLRSKLRPL